MHESIERPHEFRRLTEITGILIRYGFEDAMQRLGFDRVLAGAGHMLHWHQIPERSHLSPPQRLRQALEEMGPTFVKLGQILSTRVDLLPREFIAELEKLKDEVKAVPYGELTKAAEADLGYRLADAFAEIDQTPLAAGSIAQVHRAKLRSGEDVVIKIRRPRIGAVIESDLKLLTRIADLAASQSAEIRRLRPREIVSEFSRSIRNELDLAHECRNAERIAQNLRDTPGIVVPKVYWQWTSEVLNVQEHIGGVPGTDIAAARTAGLDLRAIAALGANAVLKMILEDRFFHADPHGGNVFFLPGNRLAFIDFGMVGYLSEQRRDQLVDLLFGIVERRPERVATILLQWADVAKQEAPQLVNHIDAFIDRIHGVPLKLIHPTALALDLIAIMREHQLSLPPDLSALIKAFASLEGMGRELDPDFDMVAVAQPFLQRLLVHRYSPERLARLAKDGFLESADLLAHLPADLRKLLTSAREGNIELQLELNRMDHFLDRLDRSLMRLAVGVVISALIVGSSIVVAAAGDRLPIGLSAFAMLGFFAATLGGAWLLYAIWRGRR